MRSADGGSFGKSDPELGLGEAPLVDPLSNRNHVLLRAANHLGVGVLLVGHWGDQVLCDRSYLIDLTHRFQWLKVWAHLKELPRWFAVAMSRRPSSFPDP